VKQLLALRLVALLLYQLPPLQNYPERMTASYSAGPLPTLRSMPLPFRQASLVQLTALTSAELLSIVREMAIPA
jgi:hypothetical protein